MQKVVKQMFLSVALLTLSVGNAFAEDILKPFVLGYKTSGDLQAVAFIERRSVDRRQADSGRHRQALQPAGQRQVLAGDQAFHDGRQFERVTVHRVAHRPPVHRQFLAGDQRDGLLQLELAQIFRRVRFDAGDLAADAVVGA